METLPVSRLPVGVPLAAPLLHRSGSRLHDRGETLTRRHIALMGKAGIERVELLGPLDRPERWEEQLKTRDVHVHGLKPGERLAWPIYDDENRLVLDSGALIDERAIGALLRHEIETVRVAKSRNELALHEVSSYRRLLRSHIEQGKPISGLSAGMDEISLRSYLKALGRADEIRAEIGDRLQLRSGEHATSQPVTGGSRTDYTERKLQPLKALHASLLANVGALLETAALYEPILLADVNAAIEGCRKAFQHGRAEICRIASEANSEQENRAAHTVNVMVLCMALALVLGYDDQAVARLLEVALLHDFGMERVPDSIVRKPGRLSPGEKEEVKRHTAYGLEIADGITGLPTCVALAVYQSHEEPSGRGYPRGLKDHEIHDLAKLVRCASSYSALTAPRAYRKQMLPRRAMEELLRQTAQERVEAGALRALLRGIGLYPIGSWVELEDGAQGLVIDTGGSYGDAPLVRVLAVADVSLAEPRDLDTGDGRAPRVRIPITRPRWYGTVGATAEEQR